MRINVSGHLAPRTTLLFTLSLLLQRFDLVRRCPQTDVNLLKFFKNSINTARTKIKDANKLQNKISKTTGHKNDLHASKVKVRSNGHDS